MAVLPCVDISISAALAVVVLLSYFFGLAIYNLYFHPLAKFPGPKLTAATKLYEFYHDVVRGGQFYKEIQRMHVEYGPIVRINPDEIHVNDASYYETLYAGGSHKRDKYVITTSHHDLHRIRRGALNPFFSKASVSKLEPMLRAKADDICRIMMLNKKHDRVFEFGAAYMSFALDTVTHYAFGKAGCWGCLDGDDFSGDWKEAIIKAFENATLIRYIPWMTKVLRQIPHEWIGFVHRPMGMFFKSAWLITKTVDDFFASEVDMKSGALAEETIFSSLRGGKLPDLEKTRKRLLDEGTILVVAGGEAITQLLTIVSYFLCDNLHILARLQQELKTAFPEGSDDVTWDKAQNLPYLTAVIQEGLRISAIVTTRLPRISPDEALIYGDHIIPAGTPVSMTSHFIHLDPTIWPDPFQFEPERWTPDATPGVTKGQKQFLVPFSKGTRGCLGINLTYAQAYLVIAKVFRRFDFDLYETDRRDVTIVRDCFNGQPYVGSKGVRARVIRVLD
ncbi:putative cytochrome P450 [Elsinoe ampelina]|uniref:Putative cytochrome P450 n=1 Tax=Elsinoe ampelina TaxID=302913 RepID=A0A6A6G4V3_9PEZI|nr:putative cytochrome P450 [Elsinoe ampelina]